MNRVSEDGELGVRETACMSLVGGFPFSVLIAPVWLWITFIVAALETSRQVGGWVGSCIYRVTLSIILLA